MPFQVSPGVNVSEIDLTTVVPAVSSTEGAISGVFRWGPVEQRVLVDSESNLAARFGKPTSFNAETFFTAANFLSYGNKLYVVRAADVVPAAANNVDGNTAYVTVSASNTTFEVTERTGNTSANVVANTTSMLSLVTAANVFVSKTGTLTAVGLEATSTNTQINVTNVQKFIVKNEVDYQTKQADFKDETDVLFAAKYPGELGNSLRVSVCDSANAFTSTIDIVASGVANTISPNSSMTISVGSNIGRIAVSNTASGSLTDAATAANTIARSLKVGDIIIAGNSTIGTQDLQITTISDVVEYLDQRIVYVKFNNVLQLAANVASNTITRAWEFYQSVDGAPGQSDYVAGFGNTVAQDELHVVVVDEGGKISGVPGTTLEVFQGLSRASDAKSGDGAATYVADVINLNSNYVWFTNARAGAAVNTAINVASSQNALPADIRFVGGLDGADETSVSFSALAIGYDMFASAEDIDVSLILQGKARSAVTETGVNATTQTQLANYIIDNVCEVRKDCVAFISPAKGTVVSNAGDESADIVKFRDTLRSTSYAVLDSGYKYQYDKYNDVYRWIPLNGDTAGLCVRTDSTRDPWWSPAGFNRGQIKNIVKLAYNPSKAHRDVLYKAGVNPVVTFPGQGTILYGDKTLLAKPSAFDRINVRRLFIVLEKAIATAAKFTLFEFNDDFTRSQFRNLVEPFLRDVQGRRGIYDFKVVCDTTNNTGEVIDRNEFVGDIYIKPAKSINFIQLNFVAVRTGVEFSEVVGKF